MNHRSISRSILVAIALAVTYPGGAWAEDHKAEASKQAEAAMLAAQKGDTVAAGQFLGAARTHAEAAQQERANPHLDAGIKNLDLAIEESRKGDAAATEDAAHAALTHLKAAEKSF